MIRFHNASQTCLKCFHHHLELADHFNEYPVCWESCNTMFETMRTCNMYI